MKTCVAGLALALTLFAAQACAAPVTDGQDEDYVADGNTWPGMGASESAPEGEALQLPPGLEIEAPIMGYNSSDPTDCDAKYEDAAVGQGELVRLCLVFRNRTGRPIRLELPPGLMFVSRSRDVQNGVLAQLVAIEIPASPRFAQPIFLYCTNSDFDGSSPEQAYDVGPVVSYPEMKKLFEFLSTKRVDSTNFPIVAQAITDLTDSKHIYSLTREGLDALPDL